MKLILQISDVRSGDAALPSAKGAQVLMPPIGDTFWLYRVPVSLYQAIVGFPKMGGLGIGFQREIVEGIDLPCDCETVEIYEFIKRNKGDRRIRRDKCLDAIRMIQAVALDVRRADTARQLESETSDRRKLEILKQFLRGTGSHVVEEAIHPLTTTFTAHKYR